METSAAILLVDDEPNVTDALKRALRREPYRILTATSGAAGLELLARQHIDVVVSDEQMPGMSGSVFLSAVRKEYPHTIRMILSGQASLEAAVARHQRGRGVPLFPQALQPPSISRSPCSRRWPTNVWKNRAGGLLREYQRQASLLARIELESPGLMSLDTDDDGALLVDEADGEGDVRELLSQIESAMTGR